MVSRSPKPIFHAACGANKNQPSSQLVRKAFANSAAGAIASKAVDSEKSARPKTAVDNNDIGATRAAAILATTNFRNRATNHATNPVVKLTQV